MAPEVVMQKGQERFIDIWSLGCTVFEMVTGLPPFISSNYMKTLEMVKKFEEKKFHYPEELSPVAKDFLSCCLQEDPFKRKNVYKLLRHPFIQLGRGVNLRGFRQSMQMKMSQEGIQIQSAPEEKKEEKFGFEGKFESKQIESALKKQICRNIQKARGKNPEKKSNDENTYLQSNSFNSSKQKK